MRSKMWLSVICAAALVVGLGNRGAWASPVGLSSISPNPESVYCGNSDPQTLLGSLAITTYETDTYKDGSVGATLQAVFKQEDPTCNLQLHWIQAIVGGVGTIGPQGEIPYLDPYKRDDNLPYYWTENENANKDKDGNPITAGEENGVVGSRFSDSPSQDPTIGNSITFETALVAVDCQDPKKLYWLAGFTWGYAIANDGTPTLTPAFAWQSQADQTDLTKAVGLFDGTMNNVNNDSKPAGYKFAAAGDCPTCCCSAVPLPNAAWMSSAGLAGLGLIAGTRAKYLRTAARRQQAA